MSSGSSKENRQGRRPAPDVGGPSERTLRHVLVFQLKLMADAVRDFALSPISVLAYLLDLVRGADGERSLYLRLMRFGRRTDEVIDLFDAHRGNGRFSLDRAVDEVEQRLRQRRGAGSQAKGEEQGP